MAWREIREIYQTTNKPTDFLFNQWVCRPVASVFVYLLKNRSITPNQVTFLSLFVALGACVTLALWRTYVGGLCGALLLLLAFVLDCTDGQLARIRGTSSLVGGLLDFLMDEIKAVCLVAAVGIRLGWFCTEHGFATQALWWYTAGLVGTAVVASGISVTTFMRRPEFLKAAYPAMSASAQAQQMQVEVPTTPRFPLTPALEKAIRAAEWGGRFVINYPSWIWVPAAFGRYEWFLIPYLAAHTLHLGRALLILVWRLGRLSGPVPTTPPSEQTASPSP